MYIRDSGSRFTDLPGIIYTVDETLQNWATQYPCKLTNDYTYCPPSTICRHITEDINFMAVNSHFILSTLEVALRHDVSAVHRVILHMDRHTLNY